MIDYQEIGNNIKICRIRCNLKQAELAEMVGVTSQHISHVERCQTKPSLTLLVIYRQHCALIFILCLEATFRFIQTSAFLLNLQAC